MFLFTNLSHINFVFSLFISLVGRYLKHLPLYHSLLSLNLLMTLNLFSGPHFSLKRYSHLRYVMSR